jgi:hypothetical protein
VHREMCALHRDPLRAAVRLHPGASDGLLPHPELRSPLRKLHDASQLTLP